MNVAFLALASCFGIAFFSCPIFKWRKLSPQRSAAHLMSHYQELAKLEFKPKSYSKDIALPTTNTAFLHCAKVPEGYSTFCITHG